METRAAPVTVQDRLLLPGSVMMHKPTTRCLAPLSPVSPAALAKETRHGRRRLCHSAARTYSSQTRSSLRCLREGSTGRPMILITVITIVHIEIAVLRQDPAQLTRTNRTLPVVRPAQGRTDERRRRKRPCAFLPTAFQSVEAGTGAARMVLHP